MLYIPCDQPSGDSLWVLWAGITLRAEPSLALFSLNKNGFVKGIGHFLRLESLLEQVNPKQLFIACKAFCFIKMIVAV